MMAVEARSAGLVSVPTTGTPGDFHIRAAGAALRDEVGAFPLDREARRLSQLRMHVGFAARAHAVSEKGQRSDVPWMVTLTYAGDNSDWRPDHIKAALQAVRKWAQRRSFALRYVWVAELQKRGVIHYHICIWLPRGVRMPKWDTRGWWTHGMSNRIVARHATAYLMKYLSKGTDYGQLPRGARAYGVGGLDHSLRRARRWLRLPAFVQGNSSVWDKWQRVRGGGWASPAGEHLPSEFRLVLVAGVRCVQRVARHALSIAAAGPFSWLADRPTALRFA
ncbi:MAG: hypothetical protein JSR38_15310 [Proteobacteria bacterium]|nr:hypothetical protein [Pseudomonadota bacterium]MBS2023490.1 hypothetical protein [Deltaproteobacteria bacterium]